MRNFIRFGADGVTVDAELQSEKVPGTGPGLPTNSMEVTGRLDGPFIGKIYNSGTNTFSNPVPPVNLINPLVTKAQAINTLKNLLESDPITWTVNQQRQCQYLLLLGLFRDLRNGVVY